MIEDTPYDNNTLEEIKNMLDIEKNNEFSGCIHYSEEPLIIEEGGFKCKNCGKLFTDTAELIEDIFKKIGLTIEDLKDKKY